MRIKLLLLALLLTTTAYAQKYTLVSYNVENLFDADGIAVFDDYKTIDENGAPNYTKEDVYNKFHNVARVLKRYNDGKGPDVVAFAELESDYTPSHLGADTDAFLKSYSATTFKEMMSTGFNDKIADLPSELLLLKAMADEGLVGYHIYVGEPDNGNKKPKNVQKNAVFSKFPIDYKKSTMHTLKDARPIVEAWLNVNGAPFVVFANHWKSGASSTKMEEVRLQNAKVLRQRVNELTKSNPDLDYVLTGDFNAVYNQHLVLEGATKTSLRDVLLVTGNETKVAENKTDSLYNLWYEFPPHERGSEAYKGARGTLMNIIIPSAMYNKKGVYYVDNSLRLGAFKGLNSYPTAPIPHRWSSYANGSGFSDHFPISMEFSVSKAGESGLITLTNPSKESVEDGDKVFITFTIPAKDEVFQLSQIDVKNLQQEKYFNEIFYCELVLDDKNEVELNGINYKIYADTKEIKVKLDAVRKANNGKVSFFGRHTLYKTTWEFVIESDLHILD